jgi:hypothetical protein
MNGGLTLYSSNIPEMYYSFGLDCVGTNLGEYVFPMEYRYVEKCINDLNNPFYFSFTDKRLTSIILAYYDLPHKKALGVLDTDMEGQWQVSLLDGGTISWNEFLAKNAGIDLFCKPLAGFGGQGAFRISREDIHEILGKNNVVINRINDLVIFPMILNEVIESHPLIAEFHPESLNTLRMITVIKGSTPYILASFLRLGTGSNLMDNYRVGGIIVQVDKATGKITKTGYQKSTFGLSHVKHPDTHIAFEGRKIPFWDEICDIVVFGHSLLREPHTIGWDIAVTPTGPLIIELNQYPDIDAIQVINGPWRKVFNEFYIQELEKLKKIKKR